MSNEEQPVVRLRVITPEQVVFDNAVDSVQIPLEDGLLGVWPEHAPLVAATGQGELEYRVRGETHRLPVGAGVLRIDGTHCVVMYGASAKGSPPERNLDALFDQMESALEENDALSEMDIEES